MIAWPSGMATIIPLRSAASAILLSAVFGGCSFAFVDGPPKVHKQLPYFECTSSNAWPTVDLVLGGIYGVESAVVLSNNSFASESKTQAALAVGVAALFISSAVYGYEKASSCRDARDDLLKRLYRQPAGPGFGAEPGLSPYQPYDPWVSPKPGAFTRPRAPSSAQPTGNEPPAKASPEHSNENEEP
jgi:hypothetical protein